MEHPIESIIKTIQKLERILENEEFTESEYPKLMEKLASNYETLNKLVEKHPETVIKVNFIRKFK